MKWWMLPIALGLGIVLGLSLSLLRFNHELTVLQAQSDSVAAVAVARDSARALEIATAEQENARLATAKAAADSAARAARGKANAANAALANAKTAADSVPILVGEVADLRSVDSALTVKVEEVEAQLLIMTGRALRAEKDALETSAQVQDLNTKIQALHAPPTVFAKVLKYGSYAVVAVVAYKVGSSGK